MSSSSSSIRYDALLAGGVAGASVDIALFPLDTLKTRLQSAQGFVKAGGFTGVYAGLASAAAGSFPNAALFFLTYETAKPFYTQHLDGKVHDAAPQMLAGATGEAMACLVRVPTENVKQKMQARLFETTGDALRSIRKNQGMAGFYTGYGTTLLRDAPFSMIQFPIWEHLKLMVADYTERPVRPYESALCGSVSGAFAAGVTTPLDVVKTRLMLGADANGVQYKGMFNTMSRIYTTEGGKALFSGVGPRVMWIAIGGGVFFGMYETAKTIIQPMIGMQEE